jgi:hypothetical protein
LPECIEEEKGAEMTIRVAQWATGGVGQASIGTIAQHPDLELVACHVFSDAKVGRDAGEIAGIGPLGVLATNTFEELLAAKPHCVMYSPLMGDQGDVIRLLEAGINVVTPVGWWYPNTVERAILDEAGQRGGASIHGTGIHPGGITERFPLMVSALSSKITHVRAEEFSDIRSYNAPDVVRHIMLFGAPPEEALASIMTAVLGNGFGQSVHMMADELGFAIDDELVVSHEVAVATKPIDSPIGVIEPGLVAAQRFRWEACVKGTPVVTAAVNWFMGDENLDPGWTFGSRGQRFEVEVTGDPDVELQFHKLHPSTIAAGLERNPGIIATANHCVNAIPYVVAAQPGVRTYLDLPLIAGRAAAD